MNSSAHYWILYFELQEGEHVAEIHSSFEDVVSVNNVEISQSADAASHIVPPDSAPDVNTE